MSNNVQVKMRTSQVTQPAQPFVTKAGEIWRTYGEGRGDGESSASALHEQRRACDLGPGNSSARDFDSGNPCGDGLGRSGGERDDDAEPPDPAASAAFITSHSKKEGRAGAIKRLVGEHEHALAYGIIGIAVAVLILTVGFWPTALVVALAALGLAIGRYRDGDSGMLKAAQAVTTRMQRHYARK